MNLLATYIPCWLIPLLVGAICALLGYLLGKLLSGSNKNESIDIWKNKVAQLEADLEVCNKKRQVLEVDLNACNKSKLSLESDLLSIKSSLTNKATNVSEGVNVASSFARKVVSLIPFNPSEAKAVFGKKIKENDLKIVEGIGPKIEGLFNNFGIKTWKDLGETSIEKCQEVLKSGGDRYKIHKPKTWAQQAQLAYEGKWKELLKWQDELDGGK